MTEDLIDLCREIECRINELDFHKDELKKLSEQKAKAIGEYRRRVAEVLIRLKNGKEYDLPMEDGSIVKVSHPQATYMKEIAKGICWKEKIEADKYDALYWAEARAASMTETQISGYQSIKKHLDEIERMK